MQEDKVTFEQIQECFDSFMLLHDRDFIRLTLAVVIGNQISSRRPIWLLLVAPPSSGKTTALNALVGLKINTKRGEKIEPTCSISDITDKTFASGAIRNDKETSLLYRLPFGGVLMFKDFTSVLSKREEERRGIMAQLREIYDGAYKKIFGTGEEVTWVGKIGAIGGVTEAIYQHLEGMSVMGDRFMLYQVPQPDRIAVLEFKLDQEDLGTTESVQMPKAQALVHRYMQQAFDMLEDTKLSLNKEQRKDIIGIANFCTIARSGVITNEYTREISFVPSPEMPTRMFEQMLSLGATFLLMNRIDGKEGVHLDDRDLKTMYKIAYDSIPIQRRIALRYLAKYSEGVDTAALARKTNYPTKVVQGWLEQLNALGVVARVKRTGSGNYWKLEPEFRDIMFKLQGIKVQDDWMIDSESMDEDAGKEWEKDKVREQDPEQMRERLENDPNDF
jgi:hypothetical protein